MDAPSRGRPGALLRDILGFCKSHQRLVVGAALAVLLLQAAFVMVRLSLTDVPTFDEPDHFAAAVEWTKRGDLRWSPDAPPLPGLIAGLPFHFVHVDIPDSGFAVDQLDAQDQGVAMLYGPGANGQRLIEYARWPMVGFTLLLILVVFAFGRSLWGPAGGLVAAAAASFDPTLLAHGHLVTTDVPVAGFALAAAWLLYLAYVSAGRRSLWLLVAGAVCAGGALASKFTALPLLPCFMLLAGLPELRSGPWARRLLRCAARAVALATIAFAVVWLVYLAVDPGLHYDRPPLTEQTGFLQTIAAHLPVPEPYRAGLASQIHGDSLRRSAFLLGDRYLGGRVEFYPAVLLLKTPLATLALTALALVLLLRRRSRDSIGPLGFVLGMPVVALAFAMASNTNIGIRHILAVPVFGAVLCGAAMTGTPGRRRLVAVAWLIAFLAVSSLEAYPGDLAYVNEAFGSGARGYRQLSDSNIDWGQDLARLAPVLRRLPPGEPVWLAYFGTVPPTAYGIDARTPDPAHLDQLRGGVLAVSVSILNTWSPGVYDNLLAGLSPFAQVGHSILLYRIPG